MSTTAPIEPSYEVEVDTRNRISLARVNKDCRHSRYRVVMNDLHEITLIPLASVPVRELWLWQNKDALANVEKGIRQAEHGELIDRGTFAQYAEMDEADCADV